MKNNDSVTQLIEKLKLQLGERLVSACVYGSSASEQSDSMEPADINVLIIVRDLSMADLEKATETTSQWEKHGRTLPIFMSEEEWQNSADVFVLEYADIKACHQLLHGADLFSNVVVDYQNLRFICELEVYRKLVFLRQRLLFFRDKPEDLLKFMLGTISGVTTFGRSMLRLAGVQSIPYRTTEVFEQLAQTIPGLEAKPFARIEQFRTDKKAIPRTETLSVFEDYVRQIGLLNQHLNKGVHS